MAQILKFRNARVFCAAVVVVLLLGGGEAAPAWSLALPLETPTVPLQTPAPPVKTPTVPIKTPTVTVPSVKTPTVAVVAPTVPVKTPTAPVKTPTVKVPTAPVKTTAVKTPSTPTKAPLKTAPVSVKAPSVGVSTPAGSVHTSTGTSGAPRVSVAGTGATASGGPPGARATQATPSASPSGSATSASGMDASGVSGPAASASPLGAYGSPGIGYSELPPTEGAPSHRARARIARRERLLKATVEHFQGCLVALPADNRQLLELRTGYGAGAPLTPRATAARLHLDAAQVARLEKEAVHELSDAAATNSCARTGEVVDAAMALIGAGLGGGKTPGALSAEFRTVSFDSASRPLLPAASPTLLGRVLGADVPPVASDLVITLLLVMLLGGLVVLVVADAAGQGPRHEEWRRRVLNHLRALR